MNLGAQMGPLSITKLSPNWACQMGPIHCPKFLLSGTDLCFYFPVLNVKRAYPPSSLNSWIRLVFATELTGTKGVTLFTYTDLILLPFLVFATELTGTKSKNYPFYVHRPVCLISTYTSTVSLTGTNRLGRYQQRGIEERYIG